MAEVSQSLLVNYDVWNQVNSSLDIVANIANFVSGDLDVVYSLTEPFEGSSFSVNYDVNIAVQQLLQVVYKQQGTVKRSFQTFYNVYDSVNTVVSSLKVGYTVSGFVSRSLDVYYGGQLLVISPLVVVNDIAVGDTAVMQSLHIAYAIREQPDAVQKKYPSLIPHNRIYVV